SISLSTFLKRLALTVSEARAAQRCVRLELSTAGVSQTWRLKAQIVGHQMGDSSGRYTNDDEQIEDWLDELEEHEFSDFHVLVEDPNYVEENGQQDENEDLEDQNTQSSENVFNSEDEEPLSSLVCGDQDGSN
ncbi:hypothetical protein B5X24_HaOG202636, partial [Helicoverpa armigera]